MERKQNLVKLPFVPISVGPSVGPVVENHSPPLLNKLKTESKLWFFILFIFFKKICK